MKTFLRQSIKPEFFIMCGYFVCVCVRVHSCVRVRVCVCACVLAYACMRARAISLIVMCAHTFVEPSNRVTALRTALSNPVTVLRECACLSLKLFGHHGQVLIGIQHITPWVYHIPRVTEIGAGCAIGCIVCSRRSNTSQENILKYLRGTNFQCVDQDAPP